MLMSTDNFQDMDMNMDADMVIQNKSVERVKIF
jgi:hypothetical protein